MSRVKYYSPKRRAVYAAGEQFLNVEIFERDGWICQLCFNPVNKNLRQPSWGCATIDHVVPISQALKLGWNLSAIHTRDNVVLAHNRCNALKSDGLDILIPSVLR